MLIKIAAGRLCGFSAVADTSARGDNEKRDMIAGAVYCGKDVITEAKITGRILALEMKSVNRRACIR